MEKHFDELGRITLPENVVHTLSLEQSKKMLIGVDEAQKRVLLKHCYDPPEFQESVEDMKRHMERLRRLPTTDWVFARSLDPEQRIIIPKLVRELFGWTQETPLQVVPEDKTAYIKEIEEPEKHI